LLGEDHLVGWGKRSTRVGASRQINDSLDENPCQPAATAREDDQRIIAFCVNSSLSIQLWKGHQCAMKDEWENPDFAIQWDQTALQINPTRAEELDLLVRLLEEMYQEGATILDLGISSGLVEALLFARLPHAWVVGVDSSSVMLGLAAQRLAAFEKRCTLLAHDFTDIESLVVPKRRYQIVISVQSLHHVPHHKKQAIFQFVADLLAPAGLFLLIDRIALDGTHFADMYRAMWKRLEEGSESESGTSSDDFLLRLQDKEDYPASLEEHLGWLRLAGLSATCLHLHLHRALIAGKKKSDEAVVSGERL